MRCGDIGTFHRCAADWPFFSSCVQLAAASAANVDGGPSAVGRTFQVAIYNAALFNNTLAELNKLFINEEPESISQKNSDLLDPKIAWGRRRAMLLGWLSSGLLRAASLRSTACGTRWDFTN